MAHFQMRNGGLGLPYQTQLLSVYCRHVRDRLSCETVAHDAWSSAVDKPNVPSCVLR